MAVDFPRRNTSGGKWFPMINTTRVTYFEFRRFKRSSPHSISTVTSVDKPKRKVSRETREVEGRGGGGFCETLAVRAASAQAQHKSLWTELPNASSSRSSGKHRADTTNTELLPILISSSYINTRSYIRHCLVLAPQGQTLERRPCDGSPLLFCPLSIMRIYYGCNSLPVNYWFTIDGASASRYINGEAVLNAIYWPSKLNLMIMNV